MKVDIVKCNTCGKMYILCEELLREHTRCFSCKDTVEQYSLGENLYLTETDSLLLQKNGYLLLTTARKLRYGMR